MSLHALDAVVVAAYFVVTLGVGLLASRRSSGTEGYFLGGRTFPGWAIGISLIGTMISSVTFLAYPADAFKTAWLRFAPNFAFPLVVLFTGWLFVPFFRRGGLTSAYEYLGKRFGPSVSAYAAVLFLLSQLARTATVLYLLAIMLSTLTGMHVLLSIALAGTLTAIYTIKGGFTAVVWTDVVQTTVLILGGVLCIVTIATAVHGGLFQIAREARAAGKLSFQAPGRGFSLTEKTTTMMVLAGVLQFMTGKVDQTTIQRWSAAKSVREARKSMVLLGIAGLPIWGLFMFTGTALWVYYRHHADPIATGVLRGTVRAEEILPHYILTSLPAGLAGLVVAAALSASMSAVSSAINASAMVWVRDLYGVWIRPGASDRHYLRAGLAASVLLSLVMMGGAALYYFAATATVNAIGFVIVQVSGGGICATFLVGMFTRQGDARAAWIGLAAALAVTGYMLLAEAGLVPPLFDSYYVSIIANAAMAVVALGAAAILPRKPRDLTHLTVWK